MQLYFLIISMEMKEDIQQFFNFSSDFWQMVKTFEWQKVQMALIGLDYG